MMADQSSRRIAADEPAVPPAETPGAPAKGGARKRWFAILAVVVLLAAAAAGGWYYLSKRGIVSTEDAYVGADIGQVTPLISAPVVDVRVANTQQVNKGDVLVVLDDADLKVELSQARSALLGAEQRFRQSRANVGSARGQLASRAADIRQAEARLTEASANVERARVDLARREALIGSGAVSGEELTSARTNLKAAVAARALVEATRASALANQQSAAGELEASQALVEGTDTGSTPEAATARARIDQARLNLSRTVVRAPITGIVTNRQVQIGQRIASGTPIMTIVPVATAFVDANFKEDQLAQVRPGQVAELTSDFYGKDVVFHGRIIGFAGGTGAAFSLIPAQNATGNWIKVVQRLPVRIALDPRELRAYPLRVGLSMQATVDTRAK